MLKIFGRKKEEEENILEIVLNEPVDCLCDFTYNFYWQHQGEKMNPDAKIPDNDYTFREVVEHLKKGHNVQIKGQVGHRMCSSMGVDLQYFGGTGGEVETGKVMVDGDVDSRMGISMVRGTIYVMGNVKEPFGNLIEVKSDIKGYKKFKSITDIVNNGLNGEKLIDAELMGNQLVIDEGHIRDTVGARLNTNAEIIHNGDVDLSTGILMRQGVVRVNGNAGNNTGALLNGGTVVIHGKCDDFSAIEMIKGTLVVNGDAGKFMGAQRKKGIIFAKKGSPIPPTEERDMDENDRNMLLRLGMNPNHFKKFA
jgi:formylmethanofuran dehydrogenase subunit C